MKCVVTGGAGFIGSNLTEALVGRGEDVSVFDNLSTGFAENLANVDGRITFVESRRPPSPTSMTAISMFSLANASIARTVTASKNDSPLSEIGPEASSAYAMRRPSSIGTPSTSMRSRIETLLTVRIFRA